MPASPAAASSTVVVYWRPMCGYCVTLKRRLTALGVPFEEIDIWQDRAQADVVREATGGDEIVPTVRVGDRFLVNPTADQVVATMGAMN